MSAAQTSGPCSSRAIGLFSTRPCLPYGERVVALREDRPGDKRLVAYFVAQANADLTTTELRKHLRRTLPDYMIPQHFVELDELPRTPNGKTDRKALPSVVQQAGGDGEEHIAPRDAAETLLARLWAEALGVDRVSVHENFFDLGGHSLLSIQVLARVADETGIRLSPRVMLLNTLEQIAPEVAEALASSNGDSRPESAGAAGSDVSGVGGAPANEPGAPPPSAARPQQPADAGAAPTARGLLQKLRGKLLGDRRS